MNTYLLSLGFLAPAFIYAGRLVFHEMRDPLDEFHENFNVRKSSADYLLKNRNPTYVPDLKILDGRRSDYRKIGTKKNLVQIFTLEIPRSYLYFWWIFCASMVVITRSIGGILLITGASIAAFLLLRRNEISRGKSKNRKLALELPAMVELFAILVSCGESPGSALSKLDEISLGEFACLLSESVIRLRAGAGLIATLDNISNEGKIPELRRFCDSLIIAMQRGTSLSEVLARQVVEIRAKHHARMIESAGKAEIALMIPVVFLILPVSVLFALWPSFVTLGQSGAF